jgi:hypothetical protein
LGASPLQLRSKEANRNPFGVAWQETNGFWALPSGTSFSEIRLDEAGGAWSKKGGSTLLLKEAVQGQGVQTGVATDGTGRVAVYYGRRIQFFNDHQMGPQESSVVADGGGGRFEGLFWDQPGSVLGAVFALPGGRRRLETWETPPGFPFKARQPRKLDLPGESVVPANDGRNCIVRGEHSGLVRLEAATGTTTVLDDSEPARQQAPLATTPDGRFLAMVMDRNVIRLLGLPEGSLFADLPNLRPDAIARLAWDASGRHLAAMTESGYVEVWDLAAWKDWIALHGLQNKF